MKKTKIIFLSILVILIVCVGLYLFPNNSVGDLYNDIKTGSVSNIYNGIGDFTKTKTEEELKENKILINKTDEEILNDNQVKEMINDLNTYDTLTIIDEDEDTITYKYVYMKTLKEGRVRTSKLYKGYDEYNKLKLEEIGVITGKLPPRDPFTSTKKDDELNKLKKEIWIEKYGVSTKGINFKVKELPQGYKIDLLGISFKDITKEVQPSDLKNGFKLYLKDKEIEVRNYVEKLSNNFNEEEIFTIYDNGDITILLNKEYLNLNLSGEEIEKEIEKSYNNGMIDYYIEYNGYKQLLR